MSSKLEQYDRKLPQRGMERFTRTIQMAQRQRNLIINSVQKQPPKHVIVFLYNPECRHCAHVLAQLEKYATDNPKIMLNIIDATSEDNTNYLDMLNKGKGILNFPTVLLDDQFIIQGEANFLQRLTYAIQLSEATPKTEEQEQQCLLRK